MGVWDEIRPCPICGNKAYVKTEERTDAGIIFCKCDVCGLHGLMRAKNGVLYEVFMSDSDKWQQYILGEINKNNGLCPVCADGKVIIVDNRYTCSNCDFSFTILG